MQCCYSIASCLSQLNYQFVHYLCSYISSVEVMSVYCLLVILLCFMSNGILLEEVIGESCTEGFMDYSLLQD